MPSKLEAFTELYGRQDGPEAIALRERYLRPLTSGTYNDAQRSSLPLFDYRAALSAFLGNNEGVAAQPSAQAQSLGYDPALLELMLQAFGGKPK